MATCPLLHVRLSGRGQAPMAGGPTWAGVGGALLCSGGAVTLRAWEAGDGGALGPPWV